MLSATELQQYTAYKEVDETWIREIPADWELRRVNSHYKLINGYPFESAKFDSSIGYPLVRIRDIFSREPETFFNGKYVLAAEIRKGDVLVGMDGDFNVALWKGKPALLNQRVCCLRSNSEVDTRFLYYCLPFPLKIINDLTFSTTVKHLSSFQIQKTKIPAVPIIEKERIVKYLDSKTTQIDEAIAIKEQQIALLKERKQIIIQKAVTQGLDPNVPMKDSGVDWIGQIPAHWEILANRALFSERVEPGNEGLPLLSVSIHTGVSSEEVSEEENIRGRVKIEDKTKYILVKSGDIAFNMMRAWQGGIGAVASNGMVSPAYIVAKPIGNIVAEFFEYQYRCPEFIQQMDRYSKGITDFRKRLYWDSFKQLLTVVPPAPEQVEIIRYIQEVTIATESVIRLLNSQIEKLKAHLIN